MNKYQKNWVINIVLIVLSFISIFGLIEWDKHVTIRYCIMISGGQINKTKNAVVEMEWCGRYLNRYLKGGVDK